MPTDYEPCGDCGFDHAYEQAEAVEAHRKLDFDAGLDELNESQGFWADFGSGG